MRLGAIFRRRPPAGEPEHLRRGRLGEEVAYRHLRKLGYTVVARNFRTRDGRGEVDLVAWDDGRLVFVEVKTRASNTLVAPEEAIDLRKRRMIVRAAGEYLRRGGREWSLARFDTVGVVLRDPIEVELHKDVFSRRSVFARGTGRGEGFRFA